MWRCNMQMDLCACNLCSRRSETTSRALSDELAIGKSYSKTVSACCELTQFNPHHPQCLSAL